MLRMSDGSADRSKVLDLVAACLEQLDDRGPAIVDEVCANAPELKEAVRRRIAALQRLGLARAGGDPQEKFPEQLGEFRLLRCIGGGGMGVVYLAEQTSLGRKVALKLIRPEHLFFPNARERFRREVDAVSRLRHPAVVPIYTFGESAGVPYYAMEWVDGASLEEVLQTLRGRQPQDLSGADLRSALQACRDARAADQLPHDDEPLREVPGSPFSATNWVEACFRLLLPVAHALEHAHRNGVIHRDIKPSNIMLTRDGRVLVLDFGLATTSGASRLTQSGAQLGSLPFMPPELVRGGTGSGDARGDFYSLGVTLYELLTLSRAFKDKDQDVERVREAILDGKFQPLRRLHPGLRWDAETVCLVAMERDPARRYADATAFATDLEAVLTLRPIAARRPGVMLRLRRLLQRHPALTVAGTAILLLATALPAVWGWQQKARNDDLLALNAKLATQVQRTRSAVTRFLDETGNVTLTNVPGAEPLRRQLVMQATALFEELFRESPSSELRNDLAQASSRLAVRCRELGDDEAGTAAMERAMELFDGPEALPVITYGDRLARATVRSDYANLFLEERLDGALPALKRVVAEWAALHAEHPDPEVRSNWCLALATLASSMELPAEEARAAVRQMMTLMPAADAPDRLMRDDLRFANGLYNLANHFSRRDLFAESAELYRESIRLLEALDRRAPDHVQTQELLAIALLELGQSLRIVDRCEEALELLRKGHDGARRLALLFPSRPEFSARAGTTALIIGEVLLDLDDPLAAKLALKDSLTEFEAAQALAPDDSSTINFLSPVHRALTRAFLELEDEVAAAPEWESALHAAQRAATVEPRNPWAHAEIGEVWLLAAAHPELALNDESALDCARHAFAAAASAVDMAPEFPDFAELAREATAAALRELLPETGARDIVGARELLARLVAIKALDLATVAESREFASWMSDASFRELIGALQSQ